MDSFAATFAFADFEQLASLANPYRIRHIAGPDEDCRLVGDRGLDGSTGATDHLRQLALRPGGEPTCERHMMSPYRFRPGLVSHVDIS